MDQEETPQLAIPQLKKKLGFWSQMLNPADPNKQENRYKNDLYEKNICMDCKVNPRQASKKTGKTRSYCGGCIKKRVQVSQKKRQERAGGVSVSKKGTLKPKHRQKAMTVQKPKQSQL